MRSAIPIANGRLVSPAKPVSTFAENQAQRGRPIAQAISKRRYAPNLTWIVLGDCRIKQQISRQPRTRILVGCVRVLKRVEGV